MVQPPDAAAAATLWVHGDAALIIQVLVNLLQNAARYSPPRTLIEIDTVATATMVQITISDRGVGVPIAVRDQLFTPAWRGDAAVRLAEGTGMGLVIAQTFAKAQGGDVRFEPRDGRGSRFTVSLPLVAASTRPGAPE